MELVSIPRGELLALVRPVALEDQLSLSQDEKRMEREPAPLRFPDRPKKLRLIHPHPLRRTHLEKVVLKGRVAEVVLERRRRQAPPEP